MLDPKSETPPPIGQVRLAQPPIPRYFSAPSGIVSADLGAAKETFRTNANNALKGIVDDAAETIGGVVERLTKLDAAKVAEALEGFAQRPLDMLAAAGRLVRRGIEKLKAAIDAIASIFGNEALAQVKAKVGELWEAFKSGKFTSEILTAMFGTTAVDQYIADILSHATPDKDKIDKAANALAPLAQEYTRKVNLLKALRKGIGLAAAFLMLFNFAGPWATLAAALGYLAVIGGTVLVGSEYTGQHRLFGWADGVKQITATIAAT